MRTSPRQLPCGHTWHERCPTANSYNCAHVFMYLYICVFVYLCILLIHHTWYNYSITMHLNLCICKHKNKYKKFKSTYDNAHYCTRSTFHNMQNTLYAEFTMYFDFDMMTLYKWKQDSGSNWKNDQQPNWPCLPMCSYIHTALWYLRDYKCHLWKLSHCYYILKSLSLFAIANIEKLFII